MIRSGEHLAAVAAGLAAFGRTYSEHMQRHATRLQAVDWAAVGPTNGPTEPKTPSGDSEGGV